MSANSKIEWTDATWNPVRGCTKISPGCKHCYRKDDPDYKKAMRGRSHRKASVSLARRVRSGVEKFLGF